MHVCTIHCGIGPRSNRRIKIHKIPALFWGCNGSLGARVLAMCGGGCSCCFGWHACVDVGMEDIGVCGFYADVTCISVGVGALAE